MSITFSTCFYIIKSKFDPSIYLNWMNNFLSIVNEFYLVIYTDENTFQYLPKIENTRIKIIIKNITEFYNYKYKDFWIKNHEKNTELKDMINWEVNMLWCEKVWFVNETIYNNYFDTDFYGWCDIGYFRNEIDNTHTNQLSNWANSSKISSLDSNKIHYSLVNNSSNDMSELFNIINQKNDLGLPIEPIPEKQMSIAGGFFILHKSLIDIWCKTFDTKLELYFKNNYLVKDDQMIIIDCILSDTKLELYFKNNYLVKDDQIIIIDCILSDSKLFFLHTENMLPRYDNWFMFQRILS